MTNSISKIAALLILVMVVISFFSCAPVSELSGEVLDTYNKLDGRIHRTSGLRAQYWYDEDLYATRGLSVYRSEDFGLNWVRVAVLGSVHGSFFTRMKHYVARTTPVAKLLGRDLQIEAVRVLTNGVVLATYGPKVFWGRLSDGEVVELVSTSPNVASFLGQGWTEDHQGVVYVGQYQAGATHTETGLFCSFDSGSSWDRCATFTRDEIRHIHAVQLDPYENRLYVLTGDGDDESSILFSTDNGETFSTLGSGSQLWRAVSIAFTKDHIYWGMDSWIDNQLLRYDRSSGQLEVLITIQNPFFYNASDSLGHLFFSTAVEDPVKHPHSSWCADLWEITELDGSLRKIGNWRRRESGHRSVLDFAHGEAPEGWVALKSQSIQGFHDDEAIVLNTNSLPQRINLSESCN